MERNTAIRFATLITLVLIFEAAIIVATKFGARPEWTPQILISLFVASSLAGRAISYLTIFEWVRAPFTVVVPHSSGAGEDVRARTDRGPVVQVIGDWISCPICSGTWAALGLALAYVFFPARGELLIYVVAAGSAGSVITRVVELLEWSKCVKNEEAGRLNRINKEYRRRV